jgi:flagellar export protein FliJ
VKKFNFAFERAMDWREKKAEQERLELQRLNGVRTTLERRQENLVAAADEANRSLTEAGHVSGADLRNTAAFLASLRTSAHDLQKLHAQCQSDIEAQTQRCVVADRDYKLLSRLKDQRFASWKYEYNRESEQAAAEAWQSARSRER